MNHSKTKAEFAQWKHKSHLIYILIKLDILTDEMYYQGKVFKW